MHTIENLCNKDNNGDATKCTEAWLKCKFYEYLN